MSKNIKEQTICDVEMQVKDKYNVDKKAINLIKEVSMDEKEWQMYESRQRWIADIKIDMICAKEEVIKERGKKRKSRRFQRKKHRNSKENTKKRIANRYDM